MNLKKFISAAVVAAMLCASLPTGTVVNFAEDTLKANAVDAANYPNVTTEPYYSTTEPYSYYYGSETPSEAASWEVVEETARPWYEDATEVAATDAPPESIAETAAWEETTYPYWWNETTEAWEETTRETETATDSKSLGDVNGDGEINSKDAVLVLNAYANELVNKESTVDASIGDLNNDGIVNSKDAIIILQYYANKLVGYAGSLTDFISSITPDTDLPTTSAEITIGTVTVKDGYKVDVPVTISNNSGFAGGGLVFNFNKKGLGFNGVSGSIVGSLVGSGNNNSVSVTFANSRNRTDNGTMFTLHFALPVSAKAGDVFNISGSIDTFCDEYGRNLPVKITNGAVKIDESYMTDKNVTYNHINDNETVIEVGNVAVSKEDIGKKVKVPVAIFNTPGFAGTGIKYVFDSKMTFSSIEGILIGSPVKSTAGNVVAVTSATSSDLTADSVLYYLNFELPENAKAGDVYNISIEMKYFANAEANDVETKVYGGSITIVGNSEPLKATVKTNELEVGKKTTIEANQDNLTYATTDSNVAVVSKSGEITAISAGTAIITVINSDGETDHIVITVKGLSLETTTPTENKFLGDVNDDGSIDSEDAIEVLDFYSNKLLGKDYSFYSYYGYHSIDSSIGDVNSDGTVNSKDAVFILQYYANKLVGYAGNLTDFISSITPDTALPATSAEITIGTVTVKDGYKVDVPVTISNNSGFAGGGIVFNFNKKGLGFNRVSGYLVGCLGKSVNNNSLAVTFARDENITDNETMFTLHFALPVSAKAGDVFNISGSIDTFCDEYGRNLPVKITDGAVKIDEDYMTDKNVTYNHVNDNETVIEVGNVKVSKEDIGEKVKVPVAIFNNPGFAGTGFGYTYDERMTFSSIDGILIGSPVTASGTNYEAVTSAKSSDLTADSVLYYLNFELPENAKAGDVFSILPSRDVFANADGKDVKVELYGGSITIVGDSEPLKATVKTNELEVGKKTTIEANQDNLTYATSDSNVAVVSKSGEITAISAGTAIITVINSDGETDKIVMTVKDLNLETTIPTENKFLGDLNSDGKTDSKDAVIVLKSYAEKLAGNPTKDDTSAGDVNGDGEVDSKDAVIILRYYASVIAGVFKGNISEFK